MNQTSFFPVQIAHQEPYGGNTNDLKVVGYTKDRIKYAVKRESDASALPIAEWIGHHLCQLAGVATPEFAVVECVGGEIAFGSRWEESALQISDAMPTQDRLLHVSQHSTAISRVHAVDRVYANPDRHAGNFLFVIRAGLDLCLAFDFSLAGPRNHDAFGRTPLPPSSNTLQLMGIVRDHLGTFNDARYQEVLNNC